MLYGTSLWVTLILSVALLFILIFKLVRYFYINIPLLINQLKDIKQLKEDLLTKYK